MIVGIVFVESGQRRIPVQFAKRVVGRRMYGGQSTYIPLKVNQSGVIPVIFAELDPVVPGAHRVGAREQRRPACSSGSTTTWSASQSWWYIGFYTLLIIFFAYFYTAIAFNPAAAGRHHPQAGRVHPRHPARAARPSGTSPRC